MTPAKFREEVLRCENRDWAGMRDRLKPDYIIRLLHGMTGLQTEIGEFADEMKRHVHYGKPLDITNLQEELGDILWYVTVTAEALGVNLENLMSQNSAKLRKRYPHQFTKDAALNRDLEVEREALEDKGKE